MFQQLQNIGQDIQKGFQRGVAIQDKLADIKYGQVVEGSGSKSSKDKITRKRYSHSIIPGLAGGYYGALERAGITASTPAQLTGALGARLLTDVADDASRHTYWRYNHPMAIADVAAEQLIGDRIYNYDSAQRAVIELAAVGVPVSASLGVFDITNPGELGRPKGFAQSYAEEGSEDRRQTGQVLPELIDRFALGRQGRPLKFETAQEDIPGLTKQRYANYMNYLYNEKGPLGVGIVKGTMENLQGEPELRIVGFPVGLQAAGALAGGAGATGALLRSSKDLPRARTTVAVGAGGALAGAAIGKIANAMIAEANRPKLPTTQEYSQISSDRI
jgi:hypothetical protein